MKHLVPAFCAAVLSAGCVVIPAHGPHTRGPVIIVEPPHRRAPPPPPPRERECWRNRYGQLYCR